MKLHILVEGPSDKLFLESWLPRLLPNHTFSIYPHQGKGKLSRDPKQEVDPHRRGLLDQLPAKLRAFGKSLTADTDRVVVLVDADDQDCCDLKSRLVSLLDSCHPQPLVKFRIAVRETEAFFLGDLNAIKKAYPKAKLNRIGDFRPDEIEDSPKQIAKIVGSHCERKMEWSETISPHLKQNWAENKSESFQTFCRGLLAHCGEPIAPVKKKVKKTNPPNH